MLLGYIKTKRYVPDSDAAWNTVEKLPNRVSFGTAISPVYYFISILVVALLCGIIIFFVKRTYV
jgi:hypothetical protein